MVPNSPPTLGIVVVSFNASDVILDCLESLLAGQDAAVNIVVVDNASPDGTADLIEQWAKGTHVYTPSAHVPFPITPTPKPLVLHDTVPAGKADTSVTLLRAPVNGGFAAGVNLGLDALSKVPEITRFWILNPDSIVPAATPKKFAEYGGTEARFSLMGGRVSYVDPPDQLQSDGGVINTSSGVTSNVNVTKIMRDTQPVAASSLDFIPGSNMVASREFYETVGPMTEDYFLYYEEVDWALRRGDLPLMVCPDAHIFHHAGSSIGSHKPQRVASAFSIYFLYRSRMLFMKRFHPKKLWYAKAYALAKAGQLFLQGHTPQARMLVAAVIGRSAPREISKHLSPDAAKLAFPSTSPE